MSNVRSMKRHNLRLSVFLHTLLAVLSLLWLLPVAWLLLSSFRAEPGAYTSYLLPKSYTLDNYVRLFTDTALFNFPRWFLNTLFVACCSCLITTVLSLMVAYVYSRLRFPSRRKLMNVSLVLGMFPGFMSMIAIYHFLKAMGLDQTLLALILVYSGGAAMNYYIAKGFFDTIPKSLDEAAILDGATRSVVFWKIILPNSRPIVANIAINAFIAPWVDFIFVSVIMKELHRGQGSLHHGGQGQYLPLLHGFLRGSGGGGRPHRAAVHPAAKVLCRRRGRRLGERVIA